MNRIQLCDAVQNDIRKFHDNRIEQTPLVDVPSRNIEHSIFVPLHYESNYSYPLLVWLHGPGDDQSQLKKIMPLVSMRNFVGVAPCGTRLEAGERSSSAYGGYSWQQESYDIALSDERVLKCIELASSRFNVKQSRIFIGGYDTGGTMAMRIAMMHPELFAGAASIGGQFPQGLNPLVRLDMMRKFPVLMMHGRDSSEYQQQHACRDLRLMHAAGLSVAVRQYPCEQEVTTVMLGDLNRWVMGIVTGETQQSCLVDRRSSGDHHFFN
jgi:phospholipase/carboxylesterase